MCKVISWITGIIVFLFCLWFSAKIGANLEHDYHRNDVPFELLPELCPNDWGTEPQELEPGEVPEKL